MRTIIIGIAAALFSVGALAAGAFAGGGKCKGDPHRCNATTTVGSTTTVVQTITAQTGTVTVPSSPSSASSGTGDVTITVIVPPSKQQTVVKIKAKVVRRWCTRSGVKGRWKCYPKRPRYVR